jgi:hypothetical protein
VRQSMACHVLRPKSQRLPDECARGRRRTRGGGVSGRCNRERDRHTGIQAYIAFNGVMCLATAVIAVPASAILAASDSSVTPDARRELGDAMQQNYRTAGRVMC